MSSIASRRWIVMLSLAAWATCASAQRLETMSDWPRFRGPEYNGTTAETNWRVWAEQNPRVLWRAQVATGFSAVSVQDGRAYTMGNQGDRDVIVCLDARTGKEVWSYDYPAALNPKMYEGGPNATPTVVGDKVYTFSKRGELHCLSADKGKKLWSVNVAQATGAEMPTWGFASSPMVIDGRIILNVGPSGMAVDAGTGKILWRSGPKRSSYATPVPLPDGKSVAIFSGTGLSGVRVSDGGVLWHFPWTTSYDANIADPLVVDDQRLFITTGYGHGCAMVEIDGDQAKSLWENKNMRSQMASAVFVNGYLFGYDDTRLVCLDPKTGKRLWRERSLGKGTLIAADDKLICLGEQGELVIVAAESKAITPLARAQILPKGRCWTAPTLAGGLLYARNAKGDLVCLDLRNNP